MKKIDNLPAPDNGWIGKAPIRPVWFCGEDVADCFYGAAQYLDENQDDEILVAGVQLDVPDPDTSPHGFVLTVFLEEVV